MKIRRTVSIGASPARVWSLISVSEQVQRWNPSIVSDEQVDDGPAGVGVRSRTAIREGGKVVEYENRISAFDPESHLELELTGGSLGASPMLVGYRMRPSGDGVELDYSADWRPVGVVLKLMSPLINVMAGRNSTAALQRLKDLAESESS